jgi:hypothetical protein
MQRVFSIFPGFSMFLKSPPCSLGTPHPDFRDPAARGILVIIGRKRCVLFSLPSVMLPYGEILRIYGEKNRVANQAAKQESSGRWAGRNIFHGETGAKGQKGRWRSRYGAE